MKKSENKKDVNVRNTGSTLSLFGLISKKEEIQKTVFRSGRNVRKKIRTVEIWTDSDGKIVQCKKDEDGRMFTSDGRWFTGTMKKMLQNGGKIEVKYKDGHKTEEFTENGRKVYTENGTIMINNNRETVQELSINDSIINSHCKSIIYSDEEIKFARIDFTKGIIPEFAGVEVREDGIVGGISQSGGKWHVYFSQNGEDIELSASEAACKRLNSQIKNILQEMKNNSFISENNPVNELENQIDGIYNKISK